MTIVLHWWAVPMLVTVMALAWGLWPTEDSRGVFPKEILTVPLAAIISLAAWLIGALCK